MTYRYCNICDKTINIESKPKHNKSNSHRHTEKHSAVVKEYELIRPDNKKIDYGLCHY